MHKISSNAPGRALFAAAARDLPTATRKFAPISATGSTSGEMPTTGRMRPGPAGTAPLPLEILGVVPVAIKVDKAAIDAPVEEQTIDNGKMHDPSGPYVVSWYKTTGKLGEADNIVMAGHLDWYGVAQAVFYHVGDLKKSDRILLTGEDKKVYAYTVDWVKDYVVADLDAKAIDQIVGPTQSEKLTLITCGGTWDAAKQEYVERTVVRASRAD